MTKTQRKSATGAGDSFHKHYAAIWGEHRWKSSLYPALLMPTRYACLASRFAPLGDTEQRIRTECRETRPLLLPDLGISVEGPNMICYERSLANLEAELISTTAHWRDRRDEPFPPPVLSRTGLLSHWNLDGASLLVAHLMNIQAGDRVLDLCAAPGGKSIALAQKIWPHLYANDPDFGSPRSGCLYSNELDGPRQRRLAENLKAYLPKVLFESGQVRAMRLDGTKPGIEIELCTRMTSSFTPFDKVLVDAPCSSERHIIHTHAKAKASGRNADELTNWRPGSSKRMATVQKDILMTGLKAVKMGGIVLYATCSIDPTENDGVVEKALAQVEKEREKGAKWNVKIGFREVFMRDDIEPNLETTWAERTKHGWIVLPDHPHGGRWGPLFFTVFRKLAP